MRVGIVGTGSMGQTHAAGWAETEAVIGGFVSKDGDKAQDVAQKYGAQLYPDLAVLLADVDVVDVCAPTHLHFEMVLQAAAAGKDIVCEKPLARTIDQAQEMIAVCKEAGVKLIVAHVVRFFPEYAQAQRQVAAGELGQPAVIRLRRGTFQPKGTAGNWFMDVAKSGGMMLDLMIHDFDYARWVAGEVATVYAKKISSQQPSAGVDHGLVILTHRNGTLTHVEGSWAYPPPLFRTQLEIACANGWLRFESEETAALTSHLHKSNDDQPDVPLPGSPLQESPYTTQIKAFYDCLVGKTAVPITGEDGLAALQIALAAIQSAETGQPVHLAEVTS